MKRNLKYKSCGKFGSDSWAQTIDQVHMSQKGLPSWKLIEKGKFWHLLNDSDSKV